MNLSDMLHKKQTQREQDAATFQSCDDNLCMICNAYGTDKRSLFISSFYEMKEVAPEFLDLADVPDFKDRGYYLRICKSCRGEILDAIRQAINVRCELRSEPKDHDGTVDYDDGGSSIPVRINGRTVMMNVWQYEEYQARQKPDEPGETA
jgi:hypothetical protein